MELITFYPIFLQNTLTVSSQILGGMIVTKPGVTWGFSCDYDTVYEVGDDLTVKAASISQGFSQTNAQFAFAFDFYTDGSFEDVQDTAEYSVGQHINFGGKILPEFWMKDSKNFLVKLGLK